MKQRIKLRALEKNDLEVMYRWENDTSLWDVSGYSTPFSRDALSDFIDASMSAESIYSSGQLRLVIELDGVAVGCVDLFEFEPRDRRAGVGILVYDKQYRRQGVAQEALMMLVDYAQRILNIENLWAYIPTGNLPSRTLFEKVGFTSSGVLRRWMLSGGVASDVVVYQFLK